MTSMTDRTAVFDPFAPGPFTPKDPDFADRFRSAVEAQPFLVHIGAKMLDVQPGGVTLGADLTRELTQNLGFVHGGVSATMLDVAGGFACGTLAPAGQTVLTVELKISLVAPGIGSLVRAYGRVVKPGRTISVAESRVTTIDEAGEETVIGTALGTFMLMDVSSGKPTRG